MIEAGGSLACIRREEGLHGIRSEHVFRAYEPAVLKNACFILEAKSGSLKLWPLNPRAGSAYFLVGLGVWLAALGLLFMVVPVSLQGFLSFVMVLSLFHGFSSRGGGFPGVLSVKPGEE